MVKLPVSLAATAVIVSFVEANLHNCDAGQLYCGSSLQNWYFGYAESTVEGALCVAGQPQTGTHLENSLFICQPDAGVVWLDICEQGCIAGTNGANDTCNN
ncbi:uncharacterized protein MAM_08154 [Metarhizium album ARSEF 1941]|uniref:Secreted protein n=1 Tax=Metarhizium album (strain ARSEF 1941) TaxID=1081103 RepID=A0A0B2WJ85_METAS|nr:uncharacterized protein MAM_08154 [Metarhizium album ARSEF 1941]KHN93963.1 hypothetical protein MAM_08154 [Metarhizium album ARSEF 1941]